MALKNKITDILCIMGIHWYEEIVSDVSEVKNDILINTVVKICPNCQRMVTIQDMHPEHLPPNVEEKPGVFNPQNKLFRIGVFLYILGVIINYGIDILFCVGGFTVGYNHDFNLLIPLLPLFYTFYLIHKSLKS